MANSPTSRPTPPAATPLPIQRVQFTAKDFAENPGSVNVTLNQLIGAIQSLQGSSGPSVLPSGIDVAGSTITGLAAPTSPSDAISAGHAANQYSASSLGPQLDIGGKNALKGLTGLQMTSNSQASTLATITATLATGVSGTVTLVKLTVGGTNGSLTFTAGLVTSFTAPT
jgi:hypothetical protein